MRLRKTGETSKIYVEKDLKIVVQLGSIACSLEREFCETDLTF